MFAFSFPNMISNNQAQLKQDKQAIMSNLQLILSAEKKTLFGDPYYGTNLRQAIFAQQSSPIIDILIDEIYTAIVTYIPQIAVVRKEIKLSGDKTDLYATVPVTYRLDNTTDLYVIKLTDETL